MRRLSNRLLAAVAACLLVIVAVPAIAVAVPSPAYVTRWGASGSGDGNLSNPLGVAADRIGNIYVADSANNRVQRFSNTGTYEAQWNRTGAMNGPVGVAVDRMAGVYVVESGAQRVDKYRPDGTWVLTVGLGGGSGPGQFGTPGGVAVDAWGFIYVTDGSLNRVQRFAPDGSYLSTFGSGVLSSPDGIVLDPLGNIYVADTGNNRIVKFSPTGGVARTFGSPGTASGQLTTPRYLAFAADGNLLVTDWGNARVQAFSTSGVYKYQFGTTGGPGVALVRPMGVATDGSGIYVTDNSDYSVKKYTFGAPKPAGRISGRNRYELAANVAKSRWPGYRGMKHVVIVNGQDWATANALAVAPLAGQYDAPVLLTKKASLPKETYNALRAMRRASGPLTIHVIGDTRLVSKTAYSKIRRANRGGSVERINGHDPYTLSIRIARRVKSVMAARGLTPDWVMVFNAENSRAYMDALMSGPAAAHSGIPMLAVRKSSVPSGVNRELTTTFASQHKLVANSSTYVSGAVYSAIGADHRMSTHADRYVSAGDIASTSRDGALTWFDTIGVVGTTPAAIVAAPYFGRQNGAMLLAGRTYWPARNTQFFTFFSPYGTTLNGMVVGSTKDVSNTTKYRFTVDLNR